MRVLITGGRGLIGQHCLKQLVQYGFEVHAVSKTFHSSQTNVHWHQVDLLDLSQTSQLIRFVKPTHLLHLAWNTEHQKFWTALDNLKWSQATLELLHVFTHCGGQRFVAAGTCAEYDWSFNTCAEFSTPCNPTTLYGAAKNSTQRLLDSWSQHTGLSSAWGRIFFLYGPGEHPNRLVSSVITSLLRGEHAQCTHGLQIRDFMYVSDVAAAFVSLLQSNLSGPINIASGNPLSIKDLVQEIAYQIGAPEFVRYGSIPCFSNDPPVLTADVSRLRNELHFTPSFSLSQGIASTINSIKSTIGCCI